MDILKEFLVNLPLLARIVAYIIGIIVWTWFIFFYPGLKDNTTKAQTSTSGTARVEGDYVAGNKIVYHGDKKEDLTVSKEMGKPAPLPSSLKTVEYEIKYIQTIGSAGTGNGQFRFGGGVDSNAGLFVDNNYLYVTDWLNSRMQRFKLDKDGIWVYFDSLETMENFFSAIQADSTGNIYLQGNNEIQIYDSSKNFISRLSVDISNFRRFTLDRVSNVFVQSRRDSNIINKYNSKGELQLSFGGFGSSDGKFNNSGWTGDIVSDSIGNIYMLDIGGKRVQKFDNKGSFIRGWSVEINGYSYMAIDEDDRIYVVEDGYSLLKQYTSEGILQRQYSIPQNTVMGGGSYIFIKKNKLFVSNQSNNNVKLFSLK